MIISMHWITLDWSLETGILGMIYFAEDHTSTNISRNLIDLHLEFDVYPRNYDGKTPQCPNAVRIHKLVDFRLEPQLDKQMWTNSCRSCVLVGVEKNELWDWNRCACHCLNIAIQAALKEPIIENYLAPLKTLAHRFSKSQSAWNRFKKPQMQILN